MAPIWIGVRAMVPVGEGLGRGVGREAAAEEEEHAAEDGGREYWYPDVAPVAPRRRAEVRGGLAPRTACSPAKAGVMIRTMSGIWKYM